jgi:hypothetical protein
VRPAPAFVDRALPAGEQVLFKLVEVGHHRGVDRQHVAADAQLTELAPAGSTQHVALTGLVERRRDALSRSLGTHRLASPRPAHRG